MALGTCAVCEKLVPIMARELAFEGNDRQRNWYPVSHERADGVRCIGHKRRVL